MSNRDPLSRRSFIGGAAGVGAMAAAGASLGLAPTTFADAEITAQALPPVVPGARVGTLNYSDIIALTSVTTAELQFGTPGVFTTVGWLDATLDLPTGARLLRVDAYVYSSTVGNAAIGVARATVNAASESGIETFMTSAVVGIQQGTYAPTIPYTVAPGERLFLRTSNCNSVSKQFVGAIYQYFDANPQLNLLPTPIRVYDSRTEANPTTVVKGALADNATRVIDCTFGGAVPVGAAAAMITLTTVGTVGAGFMALWRNGLAYPGTSSINWDHSGTNVAVTTVCALDATAKLLALTGPGASTDFIIDVIGFYA